MTGRNGRTAEEVRRDIERERTELAAAVGELRGELGVGGKLRENLPMLAAGAMGVGFFLGGGIGATMRLVFRRGREGEPKARLGRFSIVDRD
jgi:hypothetical protein